MKKHKWLGILAVFLVVGAVSLVVSALTGASACLVYQTTGIPCPACGMSRAFIEAVHGHIGDAFLAHPLFVVVPLLPLLFVHVCGRGLSPRAIDRVCIVMVVLFLGVWIVRMIWLFPHTPPMRFNDGALIPRLLGIAL